MNFGINTKIEFRNEDIYFRRFLFSKTYKWDELQEVHVQTTDKGPFVCDVFIILIFKKGKIKIPQDIPESNLIIKYFENLPGFNYEVFIDAMSCMENKKFLCWRKSKQ